MQITNNINTLLNTSLNYDTYSKTNSYVVLSPYKLFNCGFAPIEEKMAQNGWDFVKNDMAFISFVKGNFYIEITVEECGKIYISVPLGTSKYQYLTSCRNYDDACNYILFHA